MASEEKTRFQLLMEQIFSALQYDITECLRSSSSCAEGGHQDDTSCSRCVEEFCSCMQKKLDQRTKNVEASSAAEGAIEIDPESVIQQAAEMVSSNFSDNDTTLSDVELSSINSTTSPDELSDQYMAESTATIDLQSAQQVAGAASNNCSIDYEKLIEIVQATTAALPAEQASNTNSIEELSKKIWSNLTDQPQSSCSNGQSLQTSREWNSLPSCQKLSFYWAAISKELVFEEPFENFRKSFPLPQRNNSRKKLLKLWRQMDRRFKMPFIVEAFVAHIASGKVNLHDDRDIQRLMKRIHKRKR